MVLTAILFSCAMENNNNYNVKQNLMLELINDARINGCKCGSKVMPAIAPLIWNDQLADAALEHSEAMKVKNFFSHRGKNGSKPSERIDAVGYVWKTCGENIAKGQMSEHEVMTGWLESPGHCKNIMNPDFTEVGVARSGVYWVQVFAKPR